MEENKYNSMMTSISTIENMDKTTNDLTHK